jgi:dipeptidyl aminopeptidase/acylaminoacyl peptidase
LLVAGESDANVNPANTMKMVDALVHAGKDFDMLILPGQSHTYEGVYKTYYEKRLRKFFAMHLLE